MENNIHNRLRQAAITVNAWRLFPRMFFIFYTYWAHSAIMTYIDSGDNGNNILISTIVASIPAFFAAYVATGNNKIEMTDNS